MSNSLSQIVPLIIVTPKLFDRLYILEQDLLSSHTVIRQELHSITYATTITKYTPFPYLLELRAILSHKLSLLLLLHLNDNWFRLGTSEYSFLVARQE